MSLDAPQRIDLYWRPGCGFCMSLERKIQRHGIEVTKHNIWDDPAAADHVRSVANGNETVPTVTIGGDSVVNPSFNQMVDLVTATAPHLLPDDYEPPEPSTISRAVSRILGG